MDNKERGKGLVLNLLFLGVIYFIWQFFFEWYYSLGATLLLFTFVKLTQIKSRGYFWEDKEGNKLEFRQFMSRWRKGVEGITPLQQSKTNLMGIWIVITGLIAGMITMALVRLEGIWWWSEIIMVGSMIITLVQFLGAYQKYRTHKKIEETTKELQNEEEK
jgi:hypothetical protein